MLLPTSFFVWLGVLNLFGLGGLVGGGAAEQVDVQQHSSRSCGESID
jgi:hypothetical protein